MKIELRALSVFNKGQLKLLDSLERKIFGAPYRITSKEWRQYRPTIAVLYLGRIPVGYAAVQEDTGLYSYRTDSHQKKKGSLHITSVGVILGFRGRRFGELLMAWIISYAKAGGFSSINATTRESNVPMRKLFRKLGFKETGRLKKFYLGKEDGIIVEKKI